MSGLLSKLADGPGLAPTSPSFCCSSANSISLASGIDEPCEYPPSRRGLWTGFGTGGAIVSRAAVPSSDGVLLTGPYAGTFGGRWLLLLFSRDDAKDSGSRGGEAEASPMSDSLLFIVPPPPWQGRGGPTTSAHAPPHPQKLPNASKTESLEEFLPGPWIQIHPGEGFHCEGSKLSFLCNGLLQIILPLCNRIPLLHTPRVRSCFAGESRPSV